MGQTILRPEQKKMLEIVGNEKALATYYLSGGTALAVYYLQHRFSDDLDFFTQTRTDPLAIETFVKQAKQQVGASEVRFEKINDRRLYFFQIGDRELKIEFAFYPFQPIQKPLIQNGIRIDSFRDITAGKLMALLDRFEPKDFVDLYFILQTRTLKQVWKDTENKFDIKIPPIFLGGELSKVSRIEALPKMIKPIEINELKKFFSAQAKSLKPSIFED
jgi:predicted nucleotidyltransferase component of viral defense system